MFTSIIVPLDLEEAADRALPVADALAVQGKVPVELVTVSSPSMSEDVDAYELGRRAQRLRAECTTTILHDNDVATALAEFAAERALPLVLMATRARGVIAEHVLGSVSEALLARSATPVLLIGPHAGAEDLVGGLTLVAGVDGTSSSEALLPAVTELIETFGGLHRGWSRCCRRVRRRAADPSSQRTSSVARRAETGRRSGQVR